MTDRLTNLIIDAARVALIAASVIFSLPLLARAESFDWPSVATSSFEYEASAGTDEWGMAQSNPAVLAQFGPFSVVSANVVELNGVIDETTPGEVRRMLELHPGLRLMRMIDCPGTENDDANFEVARMIREAGISTFVPKGGSVRSGGVELFLAGVHHSAEPGAEFGVHSWQDYNGREAREVSDGDPAHLAYLSYYQHVGFTPDQARAFYAFTNLASFEQIHYMTGTELAQYSLLN